MEAVSFEDYINRLKAQNIIIETGNSKKYGTDFRLNNVFIVATLSVHSIPMTT